MSVDQQRVADLLVRCLEHEGVTCVFGIPGEENIHFTDALARSPIRYVLVRHEQAASFMAEIFGRLTGRAGVCSATLGPGAINLLLGTADATTNSTPVVAFSAQVGLNRIYKESHQSIDLVSMFSPVTKWADLVLTPEAVPEMVRKAFKLAQTERPGAVYLAVPEDIEAMPARTSPRRRRSSGPRRCSTGPGGRSSWPGTERPGRARRPPCGASPNSWACRWPPPSTAKGCSLTTIRMRSVPSGSCATTTSTLVSTRRT
jgi:acetolactate synthase-1/2/3 large subunit